MLVDIDLPGTDGLSAAAELHQRLPQRGTLILAGLGMPGSLGRARAVGASGFLVKDGPADGLIDAVRRMRPARDASTREAWCRRALSTSPAALPLAQRRTVSDGRRCTPVTP